MIEMSEEEWRSAFPIGCAQEASFPIQMAIASSASSIPGMIREMGVSHFLAQDDTTAEAGALAVAGRQVRGNDPSRKTFPSLKKDAHRRSSLPASRVVMVAPDLPLPPRRRPFVRSLATVIHTTSIRESGRGAFLVR